MNKIDYEVEAIYTAIEQAQEFIENETEAGRHKVLLEHSGFVLDELDAVKRSLDIVNSKQDNISSYDLLRVYENLSRTFAVFSSLIDAINESNKEYRAHLMSEGLEE